MENNLCPNHVKCPIFNGVLKGTEYSQTYRRLYCSAGESGRNNCRRYQVFKIIGYCPSNILPNSTKTAEEIVESLKEKA